MSTWDQLRAQARSMEGKWNVVAAYMYTSARIAANTSPEADMTSRWELGYCFQSLEWDALHDSNPDPLLLAEATHGLEPG